MSKPNTFRGALDAFEAATLNLAVRQREHDDYDESNGEHVEAARESYRTARTRVLALYEALVDDV